MLANGGLEMTADNQAVYSAAELPADLGPAVEDDALTTENLEAPMPIPTHAEPAAVGNGSATPPPPGAARKWSKMRRRRRKTSTPSPRWPGLILSSNRASRFCLRPDQTVTLIAGLSSRRRSFLMQLTASHQTPGDVGGLQRCAFGR